MDIYISKGKIYKILPEQKKSEKFCKQEFILQVTNPTEKGTFIEFIRFQCINEKMKLIEGAKKNDFVIVKWTISGRKVGTGDDESYYTNLDVQDLTIINKAADIIESDKKTGKSLSQLFPGLDDGNSIDEDDIVGESYIPEREEEEDDLPF